MSDYGSLIGAALPGTLADTSDHNIDGACFVKDGLGMILSGKIVWGKYIKDGMYIEVSDQFGQHPDHVPYGVTLRSHYCTAKDAHGMSANIEGEPVSVVSHGRVWVLTKDNAFPGDYSPYPHVTSEGFVSRAGFPISGWHYTGGFERWDQIYSIVELQLIQSAAHLDEEVEVGVKVESAIITTDVQSPAKAGTAVLFTATASPANATDKTGTWSLDDPSKGMLVENGGDPNKRVFVGNYTGTVTVNWVANDGSGVTATKEFVFN